MQKQRLDLLLVERGLAESRERAQRMIMAGAVSVNGQVSTKAGHRFDSTAAIDIAERPRFVSRGGDKLEAAFEAFSLRVDGATCIDIGASTGGFTDCLLQHGAAHVVAVDVGKGQLHWKLRQDSRVTVIEGMNARYLRPSDIPRLPAFGVVDVSFISLIKILPALDDVMAAEAEIVTLVKPQFEAGRRSVEKGGVVRDPGVRQRVLEKIRAFGCGQLEWEWQGAIDSPLAGPAGNVELLVYWRRIR